MTNIGVIYSIIFAQIITTRERKKRGFNHWRAFYCLWWLCVLCILIINILQHVCFPIVPYVIGYGNFKIQLAIKIFIAMEWSRGKKLQARQSSSMKFKRKRVHLEKFVGIVKKECAVVGTSYWFSISDSL